MTRQTLQVREYRSGGCVKRDEVIRRLRAHEAELRAAGITHLSVFGSVARGDSSPESDVDLLAEFDKTRRCTLLTMGKLESHLADLLGTRVDLSSAEWLKESVRNQAIEEFVPAF
ncbi:MAG TPA: nucleotidyltransferase domain-containing protein [Bryobacteraceae bacterium]|nr:nucleotidyltransferase domain-containing protein [Bryobacteraceae bacterium]